MSRSGSNNNSPDMMPIPQGSEIHPRGLLEAISYIESNAHEISRLLAIESGSSATFARFHVHQIALPMMREAASFPFRAFGQNMTSVSSRARRTSSSACPRAS